MWAVNQHYCGCECRSAASPLMQGPITRTLSHPSRLQPLSQTQVLLTAVSSHCYGVMTHPCLFSAVRYHVRALIGRGSSGLVDGVERGAARQPHTIKMMELEPPEDREVWALQSWQRRRGGRFHRWCHWGRGSVYPTWGRTTSRSGPFKLEITVPETRCEILVFYWGTMVLSHVGRWFEDEYQTRLVDPSSAPTQT